jgi:hypothetical protein
MIDLIEKNLTKEINDCKKIINNEIYYQPCHIVTGTKSSGKILI